MPSANRGIVFVSMWVHMSFSFSQPYVPPSCPFLASQQYLSTMAVPHPHIFPSLPCRLYHNFHILLLLLLTLLNSLSYAPPTSLSLTLYAFPSNVSHVPHLPFLLSSPGMYTYLSYEESFSIRLPVETTKLFLSPPPPSFLSPYPPPPGISPYTYFLHLYPFVYISS